MIVLHNQTVIHENNNDPRTNRWSDHVPTRVLNQAVKRNTPRFPPDFLFQLNREETRTIARLRSQSVTLKRGAHVKYPPLAFTEHGAIMIANVLKTKRAVQMSVFVVRAFVRIREAIAAHRDLAEKPKELERRVGEHDENLKAIVQAIRQLMTPPELPTQATDCLSAGVPARPVGGRYGTQACKRLEWPPNRKNWRTRPSGTEVGSSLQSVPGN